tara:strand:+ start:1197 stop:1349 length:153 start_codon:yes stop_codon:yes gene_type:complete
LVELGVFEVLLGESVDDEAHEVGEVEVDSNGYEHGDCGVEDLAFVGFDVG